MQVSAIYMLDPTGTDGRMEANGTVHQFCGPACRAKFTMRELSQVSPIRYSMGVSSAWADDHCDECDKPLDAETAPDHDQEHLDDDTILDGISGALDELQIIALTLNDDRQTKILAKLEHLRGLVARL